MQDLKCTDNLQIAGRLRQSLVGILSRQWVEETDVRIDPERASEAYLKTIRKQYLPKCAMAMLCLRHDIPFAAAALVLGRAPDALSEAATDCRAALREMLAEYGAA